VLVRDRGLVIEEKSMSMNAKVEFDIETHRSLSWIIKLKRIFLVLYSKFCWC